SGISTCALGEAPKISSSEEAPKMLSPSPESRPLISVNSVPAGGACTISRQCGQCTCVPRCSVLMAITFPHLPQVSWMVCMRLFGPAEVFPGAGIDGHHLADADKG